MIDEQRNTRWREKLDRAALPGATQVRFTWTRTSDGQSFALASLDDDANVIGDDRDYDLLKAVISPLEALAEAEGFGPVEKPKTMTLHRSSATLSGPE